MSASIEATGLVRSFVGHPPVRALEGVDLDVEPGAMVAVLGPSGCGKTTLLRLLAGFDRPDAGTIRIGDREVAGPDRFVPPERRHVGVVAQEGALFPHLDVAGNVAFGLTGRTRRERARRVGDLLELVGLAGYERRRPHELSGGQQQRVAVARALAPEPAVVLLDEPFAALDTALRAAMRADVGDALATTRATVVLVTHDQTEALTMADTVAVMRAGRIVQRASPSDLYQRPVDLATAAFTGDVVVLPGTARDGMATCALGRVPAMGGADGEGHVMLRPEQIVLDHAGLIAATVEELRFEGHDALVRLRLANGDGDGQSPATILARWSTVDLPAVDERVTVAVRGRAVVYPD
ncbi:MAG: ABC transporter ATP-binding protein [Ilumatobacteraceae bacterium]